MGIRHRSRLRNLFELKIVIIFLAINLSKRSRLGVGDKPMPCKQGVAGSIPGFSIKPLSV